MKLWTKVYVLVFKMPEDIKVKGDKPVRVFTKKITHIHIKKDEPTRYGVSFSPKETEWRRFALNLKNGVLFDLDPKMIKKLNYKTAFHTIVMKMKPYAWHSFFYDWTARVTAYMFLSKKDRDVCVEYFKSVYYPKFIRKHNKVLIDEAVKIRDNAQQRIDELSAQLALYTKKKIWN